MSKAMPKTNAMRQLDAARIPYEVLTYEVDESDLSGTHIAEQIGLPLPMVFKTLVAKGDRTGHLVFCIPVDKEIDLKAAAALTGNKKIEMVHVKDLLALTGYVRGGCSPVGMKKKFPTYFYCGALDFDRITVSAGCKGIQLLLSREALLRFLRAETADFCIPIEE
jgi:Cys-tRNA(Pro)/Cys-tRNA(Cys) deacylase